MATASLEQTESFHFRELMSQMRSGSTEAAWELVELYGPHIRAVVRRMLDERMRTMFDSEDFAQAVWASVIRMQDRLRDIDEPRRFVGFLAALARNKVVDEVRRRKQTLKHDIRRTRSLDDSHFRPGAAVAAPQATPSQWAIAREKWTKLLASQPEKYRRVLELRLSGATYTEIAAELEINERTARRVVERLLKDHEDRSGERP
jgi:RNA polymerase sigma factor (sigma-70 family)